MPDQYTTKVNLMSNVRLPLEQSAAGAVPIGADHLAYMADMIAEMQDIARRGQFDTLATILGLAGVEASRQVETLRKR